MAANFDRWKARHQKKQAALRGVDTDGAVLHEDCPNWGRLTRFICRCGPCARCGAPKHCALHGPFYDEPAGSRPWGHRYEPTGEQRKERGV